MQVKGGGLKQHIQSEQPDWNTSFGALIVRAVSTTSEIQRPEVLVNNSGGLVNNSGGLQSVDCIKMNIFWWQFITAGKNEKTVCNDTGVNFRNCLRRHSHFSFIPSARGHEN
jgi:hypothetical protein